MKTTEARIKGDGRYSNFDHSIEVNIPINGTEKQINWAREIKHNYFLDLLSLLESRGNFEDNYKNYESAINKMNNNLDAKYWIEKRGEGIKAIIKDNL